MERFKGNQGVWRIGRKGCVVSGLPIKNGEKTGHNDNEHYGGYMIAESIRNEEDAQLISAAPDMLEALQSIVEYWNNPQSGSLNDHINHSLEIAEKAIKKALGY